MGRMYSATFEEVAVTAAQDLFEIVYVVAYWPQTQVAKFIVFYVRKDWRAKKTQNQKQVPVHRVAMYHM